MNSYGFSLHKAAPYNTHICGELGFAHHETTMKPALASDLSSQWNVSGALSYHLQAPIKENTSHYQDNNSYQKSLMCSCRLSEKIPPVFPAKLSSYFREWIGQLFNASDNQELSSSKQERQLKDMQERQTRSFLLEYDSKGCSNSFPAFTVKPLESEQSNTHVLSAQSLEEPLTNLISTISSVRALPTPYFDVLNNNATREHELAKLVTHDVHSHPLERDQYVTSAHFVSPDALASWLNHRLPLGTSQWGTAPGTKRVANLWMELLDGEIMLEDAHPPRRTVHVASVNIKNAAGEMLVEAHQEMADGTIRHRNRPLSEKMKPGEDVEAACFRGIFEELGCQLGARNRVKILPDSYRQKVEERESLSYPGLLTSYIIHSIDVAVENLPKTGFYTVENELASKSTRLTRSLGPQAIGGSVGFPKGAASSDIVAVGVKKHYWRWVPQHTSLQ